MPAPAKPVVRLSVIMLLRIVPPTWIEEAPLPSAMPRSQSTMKLLVISVPVELLWNQMAGSAVAMVPEMLVMVLPVTIQLSALVPRMAD
jgi:hypothetical protein